MGGRRRRPSNAAGAHYLHDSRIAAYLIEAAAVERGDLVIDFGAGGGALTAPLAKRGARVIAIERDARLASRLRRRYQGTDVLVIGADALDVPLPRRPYRVVANIPFSITKSLLGHLLDQPQAQLRRAALIVKWQTARRLVRRRPGDLRTLWWSSRFELQILRHIPASSFRPAPAVDAAALLIAPRQVPLVHPRHQHVLLGLLTHALTRRRASVRDALAPIFTRRQLHRLLRDLELQPGTAATSLEVEQWATITSVMMSVVDPRAWPRRTPEWRRAVSVRTDSRRSEGRSTSSPRGRRDDRRG